MGVTKTRMAAKRFCDSGKVLLSGKRIKPSYELAGSETLTLFLPAKEIQIKVLEIPMVKSVAKTQRARYFTTESAKEL